MALDLNELADEGDEQAVPDLNEPVADEGDEHDVPDLNEPVAAEVEMHVGQEEDQLGGDVQGGANHNHPGDLASKNSKRSIFVHMTCINHSKSLAFFFKKDTMCIDGTAMFLVFFSLFFTSSILRMSWAY